MEATNLKPLFPRAAPASEPETRALLDALALRLAAGSALLACHSVRSGKLAWLESVGPVAPAAARAIAAAAGATAVTVDRAVVRRAAAPASLGSTHALWAMFSEAPGAAFHLIVAFDAPPSRAIELALREALPALRAHARRRWRDLIAPELAAALDAALELLQEPAIAYGSGGELLAANALAEPMLPVRGGRLADGVQRTHGPIALIGSPSAADVETRIDAFARRLRLSRREGQVLALVCRGESNRAIAHELKLAEVTVENHATAIFKKAGVRGRAALIAQLLRQTGRAEGFP